MQVCHTTILCLLLNIPTFANTQTLRLLDRRLLTMKWENLSPELKRKIRGVRWDGIIEKISLLPSSTTSGLWSKIKFGKRKAKPLEKNRPL
jgi:hypothetical protein